MAGWYHRLDGHEFDQPLGVGDRQGGLACCSPWGRKESDTTEWLKWIDSELEDGIEGNPKLKRKKDKKTEYREKTVRGIYI